MRSLRPVASVLLAASATMAAAGAARPERGTLFSTDARIDVSLTAPLETLFSTARSNPDASVNGVLAYTESATGQRTSLAVHISERGRTSRRETECSFPKLKLRFTDPDRTSGTPFEGMKEVKIGTHCGERPDDDLTPRFGRWANEKSPIREAFVYRLLDLMQVPSFLARPARITYIDGGRRLTRGAMFLEDDQAAMKRLGAVRELDPQRFTNARADFRVEDTAKLAFAEAMIANFDWCLKFTPDDAYRCDARRPLWNLEAFVAGDGHAFPVMYDFDVAGIVVGRHLWFDRVFYDRFLASKSTAAIEVLSQVQHTRALFTRAVLDATRHHFLDRRSQALRALGAADLDVEGRENISRHLNAFFESIGDGTFYRPVVVRSGGRIFLDAGRQHEACGRDDAAPVGTLVGRPLQQDGPMVQVALLDTLWRWAPPARCDAVHDGPVWIDRRAIGTDFPKSTGSGGSR